MSNNIIDDIEFKEFISLAKELSRGEIENCLVIAQKVDELCPFVYGLELSQDELWDNYGSLLNLQDDLDYAGIPVREDVRKRWNQDVLQKQQPELEEIVRHYKKSLIEECKKLVEEYSNNSI